MYIVVDFFYLLFFLSFQGDPFKDDPFGKIGKLCVVICSIQLFLYSRSTAEQLFFKTIPFCKTDLDFLIVGSHTSTVAKYMYV